MEFKKEDIEVAVKDFNNWQGKAVIWCDESDGTVWTTLHTSEDDCVKYHSKSIHQVIGKGNFVERNRRVSRQEMTNFLEKGGYKYNPNVEVLPEELREIYFKLLY